MFARLIQYVTKKTRDESQPLLPIVSPPTSRDAFDKMPNDVVKSIVAGLSLEDMASLAQTNKRMHALVDNTPTPYAVRQKINGTTHITQNATYAQLRKAFEERAPVERQIEKMLPGRLMSSLQTHERCMTGACAGVSMVGGTIVLFSGIPLMSVNAPLGITLYVGGAVTAFFTPIAMVISHNLFEQHQADRDEKIQALKDELNTKPQVVRMRK